MLHSFVDESKRNSYLVAAALVAPAHLAKARRAIAALVMPGQRRIHFYSERDSRKTQIITTIAELPIEVMLFEVSDSCHESVARGRCLQALIEDHIARRVSRIALERDESQVEADRRILRRELDRTGSVDLVTYEHVRAHEEALLAIPDAVAWCWTKGGHWRIKVKALVAEVRQAQENAKPGGHPSGRPCRVHFQQLVPLTGFRLYPPAAARNRLTLLRRLACQG
jgi:hypothetical protein